MYNIVPSNQFKKDYKLAKKRGLDINKLQTAIDSLASGKKLEERYHDHQLSGEYSLFRECHIEPNWLLIYRIDNQELQLFLFRTGTHSDLFE